MMLPRSSRQLQDAGVEAVAICFLHSYANPTNEERAENLIGQALSPIPISCSSQVVPEYREFERFSTTVLNAYIQPLMQRYLHRLDETLVESGYHGGLLTIASSGGIMTLETAVRFAVNSILSGPAGGVVQSVFLAQQLGLENIITCDMGGTSTDVCLVKAYTPVVSTENVVGGFPLKIPQIDINTVGAGGGSIAWVGVDDAFQVGPQSAGADPGPACYGRGGAPANGDRCQPAVESGERYTAVGRDHPPEAGAGRGGLRRLGGSVHSVDSPSTGRGRCKASRSSNGESGSGDLHPAGP